jgi:predicted enzyme related to lactoylglutathione lyase
MEVITYPRLSCPIVHLELHSGGGAQAGTFYHQLLGWTPELIRTPSGSYVALELGPAFGGGIVECGTQRPLWLPYAEVSRVDEVTEHARRLGASVVLEPCDGPSGRRSVVSSPVGGEVALWQPKL